MEPRLIAEGPALVERALESRRSGRTPSRPPSPPSMRGPDRRGDRLAADRGAVRRALGVNPSPVVELNRAVAVAMRDGPAAGLSLIDAVLGRGDLDRLPPRPRRPADLLRRLESRDDARAAYERALGLAQQEPERRFLMKRLQEIG